MHYRMLMTIPKTDAESADDARDFANNYLDTSGFAGSQGRFSSGPADWAVIGGRWSGELSRAVLGKEFCDAVEAEFKKIGGDWFTSSEITDKDRARQMRDAFKTVCKERGVKWGLTEIPAPFPFERDQYNSDGYGDDAMELTQVLYDALLKEYESEDGSPSYGEAGGDYEWLDTDERELKAETLVGSWIVVVDYHN